MKSFPRASKLLKWGLAVVALSFVAWVVPIRDRCWDARAPRSTKVAVSRDASGCLLHLQTGDVRISSVECAALRCEPGIGTAMANARIGVVLALVGIYGLGTLAWAARWRALLGFADIDLSLRETWRISVEAQAGGILLPGGLGGDALRITSAMAKPTRTGERAPAPIVVASVLLDRAIGLAVVAAVAASLGFAFGGLTAGLLADTLAAIPVAVALGLLVFRVAPVDRIPWLMRGRVGEVAKPMLAYLRDARAPRAVLVAAALSVVVSAVQFGVIRGLVFALGEAPTAEKWIYIGTAMAFIVAAVPALPGGWGTADATYVFFFGMAGVSVATALAVCLIYRLFWYLSGVVGAGLFLARPQPKPA